MIFEYSKWIYKWCYCSHFYIRELVQVCQKGERSNILHTTSYIPQISTKYSKRWVDSNHTHNFWYLYAFISSLILHPHYSYSKFEEHIVLILNNTCDVVDFDSSWIDIYTKQKISMIHIRILQYSVEDFVCAVFVFFFLCKCSNN